MTISKAIIVAMSINLGISPDQIEKASTDYGIPDSTVAYSVGVMANVNAAAASLLATYLLVNSQTEGGFTIAINTKEIKNRILYLAKNSGGLFPVPPELQLNTRTVTARRWF